MQYTVFGCGHRDWAATYQAVPTLIDAELEAHGAKRIYPRGEGDARGDFDGQFRAWYGALWESLARELALPASVAESRASGPRFALAFTNRLATSPTITSYSAVPMPVRANRELQRRDGERPSERSTRHVEIALPAGVTYSAGDHLGVLPRNGAELLRRVFARFKLDASVYVTITPERGRQHPPAGRRAGPADRHPGEPRRAAGRRHAPAARDARAAHRRSGRSATGCWRWPATTTTAAPATRAEVLQPRKSVLDLLEAVPVLRPAVRRLPRDAAAAAAPLLLDLLVAAGGPGRAAASPSASSKDRPGAARAPTGASAPTTWPTGRPTARVFALRPQADDPVPARRPTRTRR